MAIINNSDLTRNIIDGAKINIVTDDVPNKLASSVVPVMEVNPKLLMAVNIHKRSSTKTTTGEEVIYTVPTGKCFYLSGCSISYVADVASDNTYYDLYVTSPTGSLPFGASSTYPLEIRKPALTASYDTKERYFPTPIKYPAGAVFRVRTTFTAGTTTFVGNVWGIEVED